MPPSAPSVAAEQAQVLHGSLKHVPILTSGTITPAAALDWFAACKLHFRMKPVADKDQVITAAAGLQDAQVKDWYYSDDDALNVLPWANFVTRFKTHFLNPNWEQCIV